jgi:hypothetical protein
VRGRLEALWLAGVAVPSPRTHARQLATLYVLLAAVMASLGFGLSTGLGLSIGPDAESQPSPAFRPPVRTTAAGPMEPVPAVPTKGRASIVTSPRFVWLPQPGAVGYRVALYRDARLIFTQDVSKPTLVLPSTWTHDGRLHQLTRGQHQWVVWTLVRDGRSVRRGQAIVSARYDAS